MLQSSNSSSRWQEILSIWQSNQWLFVIAGWLLGLITFPAIELINHDSNGLLMSLVPEAVGIAFTVLILNRLAENRNRQTLQEQLVRRVQSRSNETAITAVEELETHGWLRGEHSLLIRTRLNGANLQDAKLAYANLERSVLRGANLKGANLQHAQLNKVEMRRANLEGADLSYATATISIFEQTNMQKANLSNANFSDSYLRRVRLQDANLMFANLSESNLDAARLNRANLRMANLQNTSFHGARLQDADLSGANLQAAHLLDANLKGAQLRATKFNEESVLPDDTFWTHETDMSRFTNPEYPDFWASPVGDKDNQDNTD